VLITIPPRAYLNDIERFLRLVEDDGEARLRFRLHDGLFSVHPVVLTMIAAIGKASAAEGRRVLLEERTVNSSTRYLQRMGLFDHMGIDAEIPVTGHEPAGRFIPLRRVQDNAQLNDFIRDFVPLLHMAPQDADAVKYVLFELLRNVLEHSGSEQGAFVAAQIARRDKRLLVGVADAGVGIRKSISRSHRADTDLDAISLALRPGITGVSPKVGGNETNGGAGLFFLKSMATLSRHHMVVISGTTMLKLWKQRRKAPTINADVADDRKKWFELPCPFPGTAVGIDLTTEEPVGFEELLKRIRDVYHIDLRKAKKVKYRPRFR